MPDTIILKNISKTYKIPSILPWKRSKMIDALINVSMTCPEQKVTCLLGPNGAGKTTLMKILTGLIIPDEGKLTMNNKSIGFVTQNERSFYWRLTGRQNLDFYGALYNLNKNNKKKKISEVLSEVDLVQDADKPFRLYSSGMRQKLHFARALLCDPEILLLDEPTTHIDPVAQEGIHKLIKNKILKNRKTTILLCTHNLNEAQNLSDKIILLDKGRILAQGSISSLRSKINPNRKIIINFLKLPGKGWLKNMPVNILKQAGKNMEITINELAIIPEIVKSAVMNGGEIIECKKCEESLFEIFTRLTEKNSI